MVAAWAEAAVAGGAAAEEAVWVAAWAPTPVPVPVAEWELEVAWVVVAEEWMAVRLPHQ